MTCGRLQLVWWIGRSTLASAPDRTTTDRLAKAEARPKARRARTEDRWMAQVA